MIRFNDCVTAVIIELNPTLPDIYRIPLEMAELHGMSQLEVAGKLGLNYTTAKARVQRARRMLKEKLEEILIVKTDGSATSFFAGIEVPVAEMAVVFFSMPRL